ncbi:SWIM zinc finger domain-containing protein [Bacillus salitolerans]|uniref:SWIM zinc finger domain-containing protein n=1 Tax=Bacillus salitolerans TaxID=1437434 RepID=A0ABW4LQJ3_9BACI
MLQREMTKEQLQYCADEIKRELSPDIDYDREKMKKGLNLFRQGSVFNASLEDRYIEAKVQDGSPFQVMLDLDVFVLSTCTCSTGGICRHKLAVFFYAYAMVDRVGVFFQEWKDKKKPPSLPLSLKQMKKEDRTVETLETVRDWYTLFKRQHHLFKQKQENNRLSFNQLFSFESLYKTYFHSLKAHAPQTPFTKELFMIHAAVFTMEKLVEQSESSRLSLSSKDSYVYPYVNELLTVIHDRLNDIKSMAFPLGADPLLIETKEELTNLLVVGNEYQYERLMAYFIIWKTLLNRPAWIKEEIDLLKVKQQDFLRAKKSYAVDCQFALAHHAWLEKCDDTAIDLLEKIQGNILNYCYYWTGNLQLSKEWDREEKWLTFSLTLLKDYNQSLIDYHSKRNITRQFMKLYEHFSQLSGTQNSLLQSALKELLPYSYVEFNDYLLEQENYHTWIELQMAVGFDISELEKETLKQIEQFDRSLLLPLYHKAINDAIRQRSRPAYKLAVRYLKKLRTQYRQLKQLHIWSDYIERLASEHKRLRAFQEELERGKLIHD